MVISISNFLRSLHSCILHNGFTNVHSNKECTSVPFSPHPHQHFLLLFHTGHSHWCEVMIPCGFDLHRALRWQHRACLGFSSSLCPSPTYAVSQNKSIHLKNKIKWALGEHAVVVIKNMGLEAHLN